MSNIPKWVDCEQCANKNIWCWQCVVKYEDSPYINFAKKDDVEKAIEKSTNKHQKLFKKLAEE